ncbi:FAD/NAD(P)-binding protein [Pseudomonas shahriarae]|uniref:FAD/NAD(P)-binding protein n=1 Tax=Pseudomonas shahriarae TaxID=2745512 RepID=A0A9X4C4P4_9PSED|nr:FAD/NAD(P)-binding protein [Pseudomonas shahriarae]MDD1009921.1 FAD/NAD(P)-binding protein [Pseudomonas shahriarae]
MKTLVIIGAGFSGAVTAAQFLRHSPPDTRVVLINRSGAMARGLAYGTNSSLHLLNVPAGNMSAYVDDPDHFLRFCQAQDSAFVASSFVPRKIYGDYLACVLDEAEELARADVKLERVISEVNSLRPEGAGAVLELSNGQQIRADQVVLAFGNFSPLDPPGFGPSLGDRYQSDPWSVEDMRTTDQESPILLIGAGLTALDVSLGLLQQGHRGPIYMISRRGLRPLPHRPQRSPHEISAMIAKRLLESAPSVRRYMRVMRDEINLSKSQGLDWRDLLAAMRSITSTLWTRLPDVERRRFLRHVQPYWDIHRHRVAPAAYLGFEAALNASQVRLMAGRIKTVTPKATGLTIGFESREGQQLSYIDVTRVINCTGPSTNLARVNDKLIEQLRDSGLILPDALGLGLKLSERFVVKDINSHAVPWLNYIGPMLKADLWEATAVPELRQFAKALALRLAELMNPSSHP